MRISILAKKINGRNELIRNSLDDITARLATMPNNLAILGIERE